MSERVLRRWSEAELRWVDGGLALHATGARPKTFDRVVAAHQVQHPRLPRVRDAGNALFLDLDARFDLEALVATVEATGAPKLPYEAALALGDDLADTLEALHAGGFFAGRLSWTSVLVTAEGDWALLAGVVAPGPWVHAAPEVLTGAAPGPAADVFALMSLLERLRHVATIAEAQLRVLAGEARPEEAEYAHAFVETHLRGLSVAPAARIPMMAAARAAHHQLWRHTGHRPDAAALRAFLLEAAAVAEKRRVLRVGPEYAWLELPSRERVDLSRARSLRQIVAHLIARHGDHEHRCSLAELTAAGWPGEQIAPAAARNRTHVALTKLRQRGLRDLIESSPAGWRLANDVVIEVCDSAR